MEVDGGGVSLPQLRDRFSQEYIKLYMKIASTATQQSNYAVCHKYLSLTEKAIKDVCFLHSLYANLPVNVFVVFP